MTDRGGDATRIRGYHAHVYYAPESRDAAAELRRRIEALFEVRLGRWHDQPVGPHPTSMYQVAFAPELFAELVPWLMLNRGPLDILVHPETGDEIADHTRHAAWLGRRRELKLEALGPQDA
jgi:DOPA 4,5-dioxygenase